jgi:CubicO group peptidase (beta-lactamase class C family)
MPPALPHRSLPRSRRWLATRLPLAAAVLLARDPAARAAAPPALDADLLAATLEHAAGLPRLRTLLVARDGVPLVERVFRGPGPDRPVNVKSVAKTVLSALAGIAIDRGILAGVEQLIAPVLGPLVPPDADPRVKEITVGHLLAMQAGLERTSGPGYGAWVASRNWVRHALSRPFVEAPGGAMLYSTGSSHLLSAVLTRASGRSTLALARAWLGEPLGIVIPPWTRDPQGIYLGGNEMALSPRALLRFGETYRQGGLFRGRRVLPESWVQASWMPRVRSPFTGDQYGYGWFITEARGHPVHYAWGYGGQLLHVVPSLGLTTVMTSDPDHPSGRDGYVRVLHGLLADGLVPAAERGAAMPGRG